MNRLSAAWVIARRDFVAVLLSKTFLFFLLGPLFPIAVGALAGGIGAKVARDLDRPQLGVAMTSADADALVRAAEELAPRIPAPMPQLVVLDRLAPGERYDAAQAMREKRGQLAAVVSGTLDAPVLTGTPERLGAWSGMIASLAARARADEPDAFPDVALQAVSTSAARERSGQVATAQGAQMVLFLLTMLLAGMVLSNLVEEKGNKIIEVLAAAIPLDSLFLGKLFAMLGVSLVGVAVWSATGLAFGALGGGVIPGLPVPAVGWPMFLALGVVYFAAAYLLLGSLFLSIGAMASTVREVQTLSMPVTMLQLLVFFFASYALSQTGGPVEWAAIAFPFSSPFAMLARAAQFDDLWPHAVALGWQALWVWAIVALGSRLFRRTVMKSGGARGRSRRASWWRRTLAAVRPAAAH